MNAEDDDTFDATLRTAMTARPEPPDATNLSARAIAMSRAGRRAIAPVPVVSPITRWATTIAAAAAMLAVLIVGYARLATHLAAQAALATSSATTASASELAPTLAVGGIALMVTLVYLATRDAWSTDDAALRIVGPGE